MWPQPVSVMLLTGKDFYQFPRKPLAECRPKQLMGRFKGVSLAVVQRLLLHQYIVISLRNHFLQSEWTLMVCTNGEYFCVNGLPVLKNKKKQRHLTKLIKKQLPWCQGTANHTSSPSTEGLLTVKKYNKILKSHWLSTVLILALIGESKMTAHIIPRHLHIFHNTPCLPPKILHKHCLQFLMGRL